MAVTGANPYHETGQIRLQSGAIVYDYTVIYKVTTDTDSDGPLTVLESGLFPAIGSTASSPGGVTVYVIGIGPATRAQDRQSKRLWHVPVRYSSETGGQDSGLPVDNNGEHTTDPTQAAQEVDMVWTVEYEPVSRGTYKRARRQKSVDGTFVTVADPPGFSTNRIGPIINSAAEQSKDVKRRRSKRTIRVTRVVASYDNSWDDCLDSVNDASVTISETDDGGSTNTFSQSFAAGTLLLHDIQKRNLWIAGTLYYRITFVLLEDPDGHVYSHPDYGTYRRLFNDQYKTRLGSAKQQYTPANLNGDRVRYVPIKTDDGESSITQPVALNGWGQEIPFHRDSDYSEDDQFFLEYDLHDEQDFSVLGIT